MVKVHKVNKIYIINIHNLYLLLITFNLKVKILLITVAFDRHFMPTKIGCESILMQYKMSACPV